MATAGVPVAPAGFPQRGEIYTVRLDPIVGSEQAGNRPAVVLSNDTQNEYSPTITIAPLTSRPAKKQWAHEVYLPAGSVGLTGDGRILINQVRTIDKQRLIRYEGMLPAEYLHACEVALHYHFDMPL